MEVVIKIFAALTIFVSTYTFAFNANQISYHDVGKGKPLVLIHAFPTDKDLYAPQEAALQNNYRVITLDLWGFGFSAKTDGHMITMSEYAEEVAQLLDKLSISKSVIGGESMGGYIALALLKSHPEKVSALILSDTQTIPDPVEGKENREVYAQRLLALGPASLQAAFMQKALSPNAPKGTQDFLKKIVYSQSVTGMVSAWRGMLARPDVSDVLASAQVPVLIITGANDEVILPEQSEKMHRLAKNSILVTIPGAGHLSNLEQPDAWNKAARTFLDKL